MFFVQGITNNTCESRVCCQYLWTTNNSLMLGWLTPLWDIV